MVTGATGFVGRHVVNALLKGGHDVIAVARDEGKAKQLDWFKRVTFISCDLHDEHQTLFEVSANIDALIHLAWSGLPNYQAAFHLTENLPADLIFLKEVVNFGIPHIIVAGTCLEYGLQNGMLTEEMETKPSTSYGIAKDTLRKSLEYLQQEKNFTFQWMRLFYMYGEGQNKNSLLSQLDLAIKTKEKSFNMSVGTQIRDFLPIEKVAENFLLVLENSNISGVINCCSGIPVTISDLVESRIKRQNSELILNKGFYRIPEYEPFEFWGQPSKLSK
jgi:dTDP-6-deoxy-L-talose 4-dehydrogenase (NAD+)